MDDSQIETPDALEHEEPSDTSEAATEQDGSEQIGEPTARPANRKRRRGSRGGRNRKKPRPAGSEDGVADDDLDD
ncbi:MAG TPA: hypothetical protein PLV13_06450, partial [Ilumatobacteraceae bacterium]|nr:hypothetical protein [Ilumatobacteraceae bacterium]